MLAMVLIRKRVMVRSWLMKKVKTSKIKKLRNLIVANDEVYKKHHYRR